MTGVTRHKEETKEKEEKEEKIEEKENCCGTGRTSKALREVLADLKKSKYRRVKRKALVLDFNVFYPSQTIS